MVIENSLSSLVFCLLYKNFDTNICIKNIRYKLLLTSAQGEENTQYNMV